VKKLSLKFKYAVLRYQLYYKKINACVKKIKHIYIDNLSHAPIFEDLVQLKFLKQKLEIKKIILLLTKLAFPRIQIISFKSRLTNNNIFIIICNSRRLSQFFQNQNIKPQYIQLVNLFYIRIGYSVT
jgi:hypothetical protein